MKFAGLSTLILLFAWFAAAPLPVAAQEATFGASPDLHASFEAEYALEATAISVSPAHRGASYGRNLLPTAGKGFAPQ